MWKKTPNKLINWPLGDVFSSCICDVPGDFVPLFVRVGHIYKWRKEKKDKQPVPLALLGRQNVHLVCYCGNGPLNWVWCPCLPDLCVLAGHLVHFAEACLCVPGSLPPGFIESRVLCVCNFYATFVATFCKFVATFFSPIFFASFFCKFFCNKKLQRSCKK